MPAYNPGGTEKTSTDVLKERSPALAGHTNTPAVGLSKPMMLLIGVGLFFAYKKRATIRRALKI